MNTNPGDVRSRSLTIRMLLVAIALCLLTACTESAKQASEPSEPASSDGSVAPTNHPSPDVSVAEVRATLGAIKPCDLLTSEVKSVRARLAEGPHTCEGQLGSARVRVQVGVPFDEVARKAAEQQTIAGLTAYEQGNPCRVVFPVAKTHGIAVDVVDGNCKSVADAAAIVGEALESDIDAQLRKSSPDSHSACNLLARAVPSESDVAESSALVDSSGAIVQGLDHCEVRTDTVPLTGVTLKYTNFPFDEMAKLNKATIVRVKGQDAAIIPGEGPACFLHTYLWTASAEGRSKAEVDADVTASTCPKAKTIAASAIAASQESPAPPGSVSKLLIRG